MSIGRAVDPFTRWAATVLAGSGWTLDTLRQAECSESNDLATAALVAGFAAAARGGVAAGGDRR